MTDWLHSLGQILRGILREIGDENAYERYLRQHSLPASRESWRRFSEDRMARKYARAKCC
jgi:hypothetical protein